MRRKLDNPEYSYCLLGLYGQAKKAKGKELKILEICILTI
jgi:hypothetical protein